MSSRSLALTFVCAVTLATSTGCGSPAHPAPEPASLALEASFPPPGSLSQASTVTVRGTTSGPRVVTAVTVNGSAATSSDGFASWQAAVPLEPGLNPIAVEATGTIGGEPREERVDLAVTMQHLLVTPTTIEMDSVNDRWIVGDRGYAVLGDAATGARQWVSIGGDLECIDGADDLAFVNSAADGHNRRSLDVVPLTGGAATRYVSTSLGVLGSAFDEPRGRLIYNDPMEEGRLLAFDLASATSSVVWPKVPPFFPPTLAFDPPRDRAIVVTQPDGTGQIEALDLETATDEVLSGPSRGTGPPLDTGSRPVVDAAAARAYVGFGASDPALDSVLDVDFATGDRSELSGPHRGSGPALEGALGLALDAKRNRLLRLVPGTYALVAIDLVTGDRSTVISDEVGDGPSLFEPMTAVTVDAAPNRSFVAQWSRILEVDAATGQRRVVADDATGALPPVTDTEAMAADGDRLWTVSVGPCCTPMTTAPVLEIDRLSGARTLVSGDARGSGPAIHQPTALVFDGDHRLYEVDSMYQSAAPSAVLAIDLDTGDRSVVSDASHGSGPPLAYQPSLVLDDAHHRLIAGNREGGLVTIDVTSGDRASLAALPEDPASGTLVQASWLTVDQAGDTAWWTNGTRLVTADLTTGVARLLPGNVLDLFSLGRSRDSGLLFGWTADLDALMAIDPATGEEVVVAR